MAPLIMSKAIRRAISLDDEINQIPPLILNLNKIDEENEKNEGEKIEEKGIDLIEHYMIINSVYLAEYEYFSKNSIIFFTRESDTVNILKIAAENPINGDFIHEKPTFENLGNTLSRKITDKKIFYKGSFFVSFCSYLTSFYRLLVIIPILSMASTLDERFGCIVDSNANGCPTGNATFFMSILLFVFLVAMIVAFYDSGTAGTKLIGYQTFRERTKFNSVLRSLNFSGNFSLYFFRFYVMSFFLVASYYPPNGVRTKIFDFADIFSFPYLVYAEKAFSLKLVVDILKDPRFYLHYMVILLILSIMGKCIKLPWVANLSPKEKKAEIGTLKHSVFLLATNTIVYCSNMALTLMKIFELITVDSNNQYKFNFLESQIYIFMFILMFYIAYRYVRTCLTVRKPKVVSAQFLKLLPFDLFFLAFVGLEIDNNFIQQIILWMALITTVFNLLHFQLIDFLPTLRDEILFLSYFFIRPLKITLLLTLSFCEFSLLSFSFLFSSIKEDWFVFVYRFCINGNTSNYLNLTDQIPTINFLNTNLQVLFAIVPTFALSYCIMFVFNERKFVEFRSARFWIDTFFLLLNVFNYLGILFIKSSLESLLKMGLASIDFDESGLDGLEKSTIFLIVALSCDAFSCIISEAGFNVVDQVIRNKIFTPRLTSTDSKTKARVKKLNDIEKKFHPNRSVVTKASIISIGVIFVVYYIVSITLSVKAMNSPWISVKPNKYTEYHLHSPIGINDNSTSIIYNNIHNYITPLNTIKDIISKNIETVDLISNSNKAKILFPLWFCMVFNLLFFIIFAMSNNFINFTQATVFLNFLSLPSFITMILTPSVVQEANLNLVAKLDINVGLDRVFNLFIFNFVFILLVYIEKYRFSCLLISKRKLEIQQLS